MTQLGSRFAGFFLVALAGLALDIAIGWGLTRLLAVPLLAAATTGFLAATVFNYGLNLKLTFADRKISPSFKGFGAYLASVLAGLATRLAVLAALQWLLPAHIQYPLAMLIVAASVSLVVNFAVANKWAFSR